MVNIKAQAQHTEIVYKMTIFVIAALLIKAKQQYGKNQNKNTGLFINCMVLLLCVPKQTKIKRHFFRMLEPW
jgi:hypothetical protein